MKILLILASVLVLVFLLTASVAPFRSKLFSGLYPKAPSHASGGASINLLPNVTANPGQTFTTPVMIDTAGQDVVGADIMMQFDKSILELTDIIPHPENSVLNGFLPVDFSLNPPAFAKAQIIALGNSDGLISFSAITPGPTQRFNGSLDQSHPLAVLQFKVLKSTPTSVTIDYTPGSTIDSNLVGLGETDLLSFVTNMNVNQPLPPITYPEISPNPSSKPGDIDGNNKVDIFDYNQLLTDFGKTGANLASDIDKDGFVGIFDYNILLTNFGK